MTQRRRSDSAERNRSIREAIATRAYELFLARGSSHGHDLDDWLRAEEDLFGRELTMAADTAPPLRNAARLRVVNFRQRARHGDIGVVRSCIAYSGDPKITALLSFDLVEVRHAV